MDASYMTPNIMIPLNARGPGEIAEVALDQLKPFRERAETWPLREVTRDGRHGMACATCDQMMYFISDKNGILYDYTDDQILSVVTAHLRQVHERTVLRGES